MEQLLVTIKDGNVVVEVEGIKGNRCLELTQAIENLIGKVDTRFAKNEFYSCIKTKQTISLNRINNRNS